MSLPTTRKAQKAATRRALKSAAIGRFADSGLSDTPIAAITQAAGVAHGTFYVHFPSKEALLDELLDEFNQKLVERLEPVWADAEPGGVPRLVERTAEVFLETWEEDRTFVEIYALRLAQGISLVELRDGINPAVAGFLADRLRRLSEAVGDPLAHIDLVVQGLLAMWSRIGLQALFRDDLDRDEALRALVRMTLGAVASVFPRLAVQLPEDP